MMMLITDDALTRSRGSVILIYLGIEFVLPNAATDGEHESKEVLKGQTQRKK